MKDKITKCKLCEVNLCYELKIAKVKQYSCMNCGFTTNSNFKLGSDFQKQYETTIPELYKNISKVDNDNLVWYPITLQKDNLMLFPDITNDGWGWRLIPVSEDPETRQKRTNIKESIMVPYTNFAQALNIFNQYE